MQPTTSDQEDTEDGMALPMDLGDAVVAIGGLGTAAFALVDASKIAFKGGLSNVGFDCISSLVHALLSADTTYKQTHTVKTYSVFDQLHANWINGVELVEQRRSAKAALKLELNERTVKSFADVTVVDLETLTGLLEKLDGTEPMTDTEKAVYGRFDFVLGTMIDAAYRRADQKYRNCAKVYAGAVAIVLAILGGWAISTQPSDQFFWKIDFWKSVLAGVLAVPLAPIAHNVASAISAGKNVAQALRSK
jgi:hypothetical protein